MKHSQIKIFLSLLFLLSLISACGVPASGVPLNDNSEESTPLQDYWPAAEWRTSTPEEQGMDSELLAAMFDRIEVQKIPLHSLLIIRNGFLVSEAYFQPYTQSQPQYIASVTKSVISTLVGIAIDEGFIQNVDQTLVSFFPEYEIANLDANKQAITLQDLLTLTAGFDCAEGGFSGMEQSSDWVQFMLDTPMAEAPGATFDYCGGAVHLLSAILQQTTGMSSREFANRFLFEPIGITAVPESRWPVDPQGINFGPTGLYLTPRDMARFGYLFLQNGNWEGQQILPESWVSEATTSRAIKDNGLGYGYLWTVDLEQGSYSALGLAGQQIYVIPSKNLLIVFTGNLQSYGTDMDFLPIKALVDTFILPAVKSDKALAANPTANDDLNEMISKAANPKKPVSIPEGALQWSGVNYELEENPNQWETIAFTMADGADTITVTINREDVDPQIGLDNVYRIQGGADLYAPSAMRGFWENDSTLFVQSMNLGELNDNEIWVVFSGEEIHISGRKVLTNEKIEIHGVRSQGS